MAELNFGIASGKELETSQPLPHDEQATAYQIACSVASSLSNRSMQGVLQ